MLIDIALVILLFSSLYRGYEIGFVRQLFATAGFFGGLFLGAWLQHYTLRFVHTNNSRTLVALCTTLGSAIILLSVGEVMGMHLKYKVMVRRINAFDKWLGSGLAVVSLLISAWLMAAVISSLPAPNLQRELQQSRIIHAVNQLLPNAPQVLSEFGKLVNPNGFPQVFVGSEPAPRSNINLPSLGDLQAAVKADQASVLKVEGQGCGGIVEGSGFVAGKDLVITNAHVVAGIRRPFVQDANGSRQARVVWFDPNLDLAILQVSNLVGAPLPLSATKQASGSGGVILGYPGGGGLTASPAAVLDIVEAHGRNIYNQTGADREVYELQATVIPGNSGGPLLAKDGSVIGVVFAESTSYQHVGYALTMKQVIAELRQVSANSPTVSTGSCAE